MKVKEGQAKWKLGNFLINSMNLKIITQNQRTT